MRSNFSLRSGVLNSMRHFFGRFEHCLRSACLSALFFFAAFHSFGEENLSLDDREHLDVQRELSTLSVAMWILVIGLLAFAYSIRYIARRTTKPCPWCMEFIKKAAPTCPRCGKPTARESLRS
jgi:hypothetical protein